MSFLEQVLRSREAKEAIGEGIIELLSTGNFDDSVDSMFARGKENGSLPAAKFAFLFDLLGGKQ